MLELKLPFKVVPDHCNQVNGGRSGIGDAGGRDRGTGFMMHPANDWSCKDGAMSDNGRGAPLAFPIDVISQSIDSDSVYGTVVLVPFKHIIFAFCHCQKGYTGKMKAGTVIATMGTSGMKNSKPAHFHIEVWTKTGYALNPGHFLKTQYFGTPNYKESDVFLNMLSYTNHPPPLGTVSGPVIAPSPFPNYRVPCALRLAKVNPFAKMAGFTK